MEKRVFTLAHPVARQNALAAVQSAPEGYKVMVQEAGRTLDQNAAMWPLLECFSQQLQWPVNGQMEWLKPEEWKDILSAAFRQENIRVAMGLSGGMVMLGRRTSKMGKKEFSDFLEFIHATAEERGVDVGYRMAGAA